MVDAVMEQLATQTTIIGPQQETIGRAIRQPAVRYPRRTGAELFGQLCPHVGRPTCGLLPAGERREAMAWIQARAAALLPGNPEALPPLQGALL